MTQASEQIISRQRVADHGEVFTNPREVNAMLDLVEHETYRIDSRFLEPACGTGNFLAQVLERKLTVVDRRYGKSQLEHEQYTLLAVCSIYGIDILQDNVIACRQRLLAMVEAHCPNLTHPDFLKVIGFVLSLNIIHGDALSLQTVGTSPCPITFAEWAMMGSMIQRRDFKFHELLAHADTKDRPLFSDLGEDVFLPEPVQAYALVHYMKLMDAQPE